MHIRETSRCFPVERLKGGCVYRSPHPQYLPNLIIVPAVEHLRRRGEAEANEVFPDERKAKDSISFGVKRIEYRHQWSSELFAFSPLRPFPPLIGNKRERVTVAYQRTVAFLDN